MANEITMNVQLDANKGTNNSLSISRKAYYQANLNGSTYSSVLQSVPTSSTALTVASSVTTAGVAYFRNTDATNYVTVGISISGTYYPFLKLEAGECAVCRLGTLSLYAQSDTAAVVLETTVLND